MKRKLFNGTKVVFKPHAVAATNPSFRNIRVPPRFFDQVGHETIHASSGNKLFFTKYCHRQTYQKLGNKVP